DFGGIQSHLLHARINLIFNGIIKDRIEHDDAVGCRQCPNRVLTLAEPIQVIEGLHGFSMPGGPVWGSSALPAALTAGRRGRCALPTGWRRSTALSTWCSRTCPLTSASSPRSGRR